MVINWVTYLSCYPPIYIPDFWNREKSSRSSHLCSQMRTFDWGLPASRSSVYMEKPAHPLPVENCHKTRLERLRTIQKKTPLASQSWSRSEHETRNTKGNLLRFIDVKSSAYQYQSKNSRRKPLLQPVPVSPSTHSLDKRLIHFLVLICFLNQGQIRFLSHHRGKGRRTIIITSSYRWLCLRETYSVL